ncbi:MAG: DUF86 domain-containing protein [Dichotomicrobium sp.]
MSSDKGRRWLRDIIEQAQKIAQHIDGYDEAAFRADAKTIDAVERCLLRLAEAAIRIEKQAPPDFIVNRRDWPKIRSLGNRLRHEYEAIAVDEIWRIAVQDVPALEAACREKLGETNGAPPPPAPECGETSTVGDVLTVGLSDGWPERLAVARALMLSKMTVRALPRPPFQRA